MAEGTNRRINDHLPVPSEAMALVAMIIELHVQGVGKDTRGGFLGKPLVYMALEAWEVFDAVGP
jgi:hypothetical protein